jgi:hypothetical protein
MKKFQLTRQTGILIAAIAVAIILVCLLLFLPSKSDSVDTNGARSLLSTNSVIAETNLVFDKTATLAKSITSTTQQKVADAKALSEAEAAAQEANAASGSNSKSSSGSTKKPESNETGPTITITVDCKTILANPNLLQANSPNKVGKIPSNGIIFSKTVTFTEGESFLDIFKRVAKASNLKLVTGAGGYIAEVGIVSEFDCGSLSGWLYSVNGTFPGYSAAKYIVKDGDNVAIRYTCDLGKDIGAGGVSQG